ncbi:Helix-turn-helix domain protein [compost metagenome]
MYIVAELASHMLRPKEVLRMKSRLLTAHQVAQVLGTTTARVYELIRTKLLPAVHLGRQVKVDEDVLEQWIHQGGKKLPSGWRK